MQHTRMNLDVRKFQHTEYERYSQMLNSIFPDHPLSAEELKSFDDNRDKTKYYFRRYSCFDEKGQIVGFGEIGHISWSFNPRRFSIRIYVGKAHQNQGVGHFLYEKMIRFLADLNASEVWAHAREDMPGSLSFFIRRGFRETARSWESSLELNTVKVSQFSGYLVKAASSGVEISNLARELKEDPDCYLKLYRLNQEVRADDPSPEPYTPLSYEQWLASDMKDPGLIPEAYVIAKHGSEYVGVSTVRRREKDPRALEQLLTGVKREYRGKGVAFAMKLRVIEFARKNGYERIKTEFASTNASMMGINMKLGFKRETGWVGYSKALA